MFEQSLVDGQAKTRRPATIIISLLLQCLVIVILILIPLIYTDSLGMAQLKATLIALQYRHRRDTFDAS